MTYQEPITSFSQRLKEVLKIKNIRASELSRLSNVSKSSISHYLKGDWVGKQDVIYDIAHALDVSEAWLMGYDVPMERTTPPPDNSLKEYKVVAMNGVPGTHTATVDSEKAEKIAELVESAANLTPEQIEKLIKMSEII